MSPTATVMLRTSITITNTGPAMMAAREIRGYKYSRPVVITLQTE